MSQPPQSYDTHVHRPVAWSAIWLIGFAATLAAIWVAVRDRTLIAHVVLLLAIALLGTITLLRMFILRVQNRVIRIEMRYRMTRLGLDQEFERLESPQLIALRFASDAEMPLLAHRAIAERLTADQIKRAVTDWQGDYYRT